MPENAEKPAPVATTSTGQPLTEGELREITAHGFERAGRQFRSLEEFGSFLLEHHAHDPADRVATALELTALLGAATRYHDTPHGASYDRAARLLAERLARSVLRHE